MEFTVVRSRYMDNEQIVIRTQDAEAIEISWFAPLCNGDDRYIGKHDPSYRSNWANTSAIVEKADEVGFRNILCPSSYQVGQDTLAFAAAIAPRTKRINLLAAIRSGEVHPPMLGRAIATIDHILKGRLTLNIISSDLPGTQLPSADRYQRSREVIEILKQGWSRDEIDFNGQFYQLRLPSDPLKTYQQNGGPLLYFGGYSPHGKALCAEHCDVYLMWPETKDALRAHMVELSALAGQHQRKIDFGLRVHVIVRERSDEARAAATQLMSVVDDQLGKQIRERALDAHSMGVNKQTELRQKSDAEGFAEDLLWTGIGKARSGCGAALVGNPDEIYWKIQEYIQMGIRSFIFSGYPHLDECALFGRYVLPRLKTCSFPHIQGRIPLEIPATPLGNGLRK